MSSINADTVGTTDIINPQQALSFDRTIVKGVGFILAYAGVHLSTGAEDTFAGPAALSFYSGIIMVVAPMAWDWVIHSRKGAVAAVEAMPSVKAIIINPHSSAD